jgi:hypothetical protein
LNDIFNLLRSNARIIVPAAVLVIILAIVIGIVIGLRSPSDIPVGEGFDASRLREVGPDLDETGLLVPGPIVPRLYEDDTAEFFQLEDRTAYIDSIELKQISISELIEYRKRGVEVRFKPFQVENVDLEILSVKDELAEP